MTGDYLANLYNFAISISPVVSAVALFIAHNASREYVRVYSRQKALSSTIEELETKQRRIESSFQVATHKQKWLFEEEFKQCLQLWKLHDQLHSQIVFNVNQSRLLVTEEYIAKDPDGTHRYNATLNIIGNIVKAYAEFFVNLKKEAPFVPPGVYVLCAEYNGLLLEFLDRSRRKDLNQYDEMPDCASLAIANMQAVNELLDKTDELGERLLKAIRKNLYQSAG